MSSAYRIERRIVSVYRGVTHYPVQ